MPQSLYLTRPIETERDADAFIRALHDAGKLFHFDDSPHGLECFTADEAQSVDQRMDEINDLDGYDARAYAVFLSNRPASWLALSDSLDSLFGEGLNQEQRQCLDDPERREECLGMLDDMQARMGVSAAIVDAVRAELDGDWQ